jgi:glucose/arabinose dehydrogenase
VVEQDGRIYILLNGNKIGTPFLDIVDDVQAPANGEEGLLSVAFPPGFGTSKNHFFVYYTNNNGDNQVSRFSLSGNPNIADPGSETTILTIPHPVWSNHNGGQMAFGPDGYLYIGTGDGGGDGNPGDPFENAQNPGSLLGKLLRIDVEVDSSAATDLPYRIYLPLAAAVDGFNYSIPPDNPFVGQAGFRPEIWALGLRNPWRFSFDRQTDDLYVGDVGQGGWEEIDFQPAASPGGQNYGWDNLEGNVCYEPATGCITAGMTPPVHVYPNINAPECAVTGGYVYRGSDFGDLLGIYVYADYCTGKIWGLQRDGDTWANQLLNPGDDTLIVSFGEDQSGELYLTTLSGAVYQVVTP